MTDRHAWIEAGAVTRPHGIRGEVVVDLKSDLLDCVVEETRIRLTTRKGDESFRIVERARRHKGCLVLKLVDVDTRDGASDLRGHTVWLTREQVGALPEGRYFVEDILGIDVYTEGGEHLGTVEDVLNMPASDIYVVRGGGDEILLPVIDEVVRDVDVAGRKMVVHLMEGLRRGAS
jgi:16S rRNA processing protein RimM